MNDRGRGRGAIGSALVAAGLFGLSTPAAKVLVSAADPWVLAGLLYLGSGIGLGATRIIVLVSGRTPREAPLRRRDLPWLVGAIITGGVLGPVLLMFGLAGDFASQTSLLLNLEGALTALVAWLAFREHVDRRIALGMLLITAGAVLLAWQPGSGLLFDRDALLVAAACLAWAIDNNLTRKISGGDAALIAALKGGSAGVLNLGIGLGRGAQLPGAAETLSAGAVGLLGYGVSLMLFVQALRGLGAARTAAYFSVAPFVGAIVGVTALAEPLTGRLATAGIIMAIGVWLHISERHEHEHQHEPLAHAHLHDHDAHHTHEHPPGTAAGEPHSHWHEHAAVRHSHPHYPDIHHRHRH